MKVETIRAGYVPLVDAAPLIVAHEMGFAAEEGLHIALHKAPSWSSLRDMLVFGQIDAAHMLSPVPVAMRLGMGGVQTPLDALSVLSVNGPVIGVSRAIEARLREAGYDFDFSDAGKAGAALAAACEGPLRFGVPFPFSMHVELLHYWLNGLSDRVPGPPAIHTIPPPLMARAMADGEIDAFCVGEPWGSMAVENGSGALLLPGNAIWASEPDKVLAVRHEWAEAQGELTGRLLRAVWRAGRWLAEGGQQTTASEILARPDYLGVPAEVIDRAFTGRLVISNHGDERVVPRFLDFHHGAATFPWRSQAAWIGAQLAKRAGQDIAAAISIAKTVFRTDLYREHLRDVVSDMPGASEKLEGAISVETTAASESGRLFLQPDPFFDGRIFDPLSAKR
ncbi:nitrate transporter [Actibacterium mucosum KCTC 23349]|uniref:Nitrate transporter n=1 Tax=Actibacterium mucosum KCTC 23349 TaxID=1454373 RepID=A0A037ZNF7_9RHOB|nr:ABC transporter substrate-binding protein [Actibacterium mucosum]KAJ57073.1 nitrate transporter [Actibacterium mucosum KCTC 23349]